MHFGNTIRRGISRIANLHCPAHVLNNRNHKTLTMKQENKTEKEIIAGALRRWWRFDENQQPLSNWHEREDFIKTFLEEQQPVSEPRTYTPEQVEQERRKAFEAGIDAAAQYVTEWFAPTESEIKSDFETWAAKKPL